MQNPDPSCPDMGIQGGHVEHPRVLTQFGSNRSSQNHPFWLQAAAVPCLGSILSFPLTLQKHFLSGSNNLLKVGISTINTHLKLKSHLNQGKRPATILYTSRSFTKAKQSERKVWETRCHFCKAFWFPLGSCCIPNLWQWSLKILRTKASKLTPFLQKDYIHS